MFQIDEYEIKREIQMAMESLKTEIQIELNILNREIETLKQMIWNRGQFNLWDTLKKRVSY